jgi:hypothetical protein
VGLCQGSKLGCLRDWRLAELAIGSASNTLIKCLPCPRAISAELHVGRFVVAIGVGKPFTRTKRSDEQETSDWIHRVVLRRKMTRSAPERRVM